MTCFRTQQLRGSPALCWWGGWTLDHGVTEWACSCAVCLSLTHFAAPLAWHHSVGARENRIKGAWSGITARSRCADCGSIVASICTSIMAESEHHKEGGFWGARFKANPQLGMQMTPLRVQNHSQAVEYQHLVVCKCHC